MIIKKTQVFLKISQIHGKTLFLINFQTLSAEYVKFLRVKFIEYDNFLKLFENFINLFFSLDFIQC